MALKVLIAHGNTQRLKQAVADLHAAGFEVVATPDGGDAFARFFEEAPDVVICSLVLPGLAGDNISRMVRSQSPGTEIVLLIEHEGQHTEPGINIVVEPMTLAKLRDAMPSIAFDAPQTADDATQDLTAASPTHVFYHAVLKRFQRDNRALQALDDSGIGRIAAIAENRNFQDGERIIVQGADGDGCFLLVEGQVKVTLAEKEDKEVARISAGGFFGEMAMLKDQRRSASVWSIGQTTTLWFSKELFTPILAEYTQMREVLSGVALKRTEENLWRMLFDDDEVQRSIAQLGDAPTLAAPGLGVPSIGAAAVEEARNAAQGAKKPVSTAFTKTISPAAVLLTADEAAKQTPLPPTPKEMVRLPAFRYGAGAGFAVGVLVATFLSWAFSGPSEPQVATPVVAPVVAQQKPVTVAPASAPVVVPVVAPASAPASVPVEPAKEAPTEAPKEEAVVKKDEPSPEAPVAEPPRPVKSADRDALTAAYKGGNYKEVIAIAKRLPQPLDGDAAFMACDSQRQTGVPSALDGYLDFIKNYPTHGRVDDAQFWAADLYTSQGKVKEARALYEKVAANEKSNFRTSAAKRLEKQ